MAWLWKLWKGMDYVSCIASGFECTKYDTPEALIHVLEENLQYWESLYGASESEIGVARRFNGVIRRAAEKRGRMWWYWWMSTISPCSRLLAMKRC